MSEPDDRESAIEADDFVLAEFESDGVDGADADPDRSGLELGDSQAAELRQIFLTTLPQYLEPLEELLEQALAQPEPEESILRTLSTTIASILAAAQRIGVDDIAASLIEMEVLVKELAESEPEELRDELRGMLRKINEQCGASGRASEEAHGEAKTLVAALGAVVGFDMSILEPLTAAGLVTVSQLQMARKHEIVAVTGLPVESVDALLAALGIEEAVKAPRAARAPQASRLERQLRAQVEAEDALSQARAEVQRMRRLLERYGADLDGAERAAASLRARETDAEERVTELLRARTRARDALTALETERDDLQRRALDGRRRLARLERERDHAEREQESLRRQLSALSDRVRSLVADDRLREP